MKIDLGTLSSHLEATEADSPFLSIKKPKTNRFPSLKGTDPKFRRNHRHALHGTMKALVRLCRFSSHDLKADITTEGGQGGQEGRRINDLFASYEHVFHGVRMIGGRPALSTSG